MFDDFDLFHFSHGGKTHPVFRAGEGPVVVVLHELPGITPQVADFARRVRDAGFTVFMPEFTGKAGKPLSNGYLARESAKICINREFRVFAAHRSSPVTDWVRALGKYAFDEVGGKGIGAIGMCLTGNFALSMMVDPWLLAPVLSQPSLPVPLPGIDNGRELHISAPDLATARRRAIDEGVCVLGLRFSEDRLVPPQRFERLHEEFGDRFESVEIDSSKGNEYGLTELAHSVVTTEFVDQEGHPTYEASRRVVDFFVEHLQ